MRNWVAGGALCLLLTGCAAVVDGRAVPADSDGPKPIPKAALADALLDRDDINDIMGTSDMRVTDHRTRMYDDSEDFTDADCLAPWLPIEEPVYADSGWSSVRADVLKDGDGSAFNHSVIQGLVWFKSRRAAHDFFSQVANKWVSCGNQTITVHYHRDDTRSTWEFEEGRNDEETLSMSQQRRGSDTWGCQRALRVRNNVAIDTMACMAHTVDEAVTILDQIDARLPSI